MLRFIQEVNTTTRSCALWDLEEETDYIVHVQSISMSGTSPLSEPLRFRTPKEAETQASKSKGEERKKRKQTRLHTDTRLVIQRTQSLKKQLKSANLFVSFFFFPRHESRRDFTFDKRVIDFA